MAVLIEGLTRTTRARKDFTSTGKIKGSVSKLGGLPGWAERIRHLSGRPIGSYMRDRMVPIVAVATSKTLRGGMPD